MPYTTINKVRVKLPEENIEYTFVFPGKKIISFVFVCQREDKRLVLMNTKTKQFVNMTATWFAKLRKRQLLSAKPYGGDEVVKINTDEKAEEKGLSTESEVKVSAPVENEKWEDMVIRQLRELTPAQAFAVQVKIGRTPEALANDLERLYHDENDNYTQEFVNRVCREMSVARDCYLRLQNKAGDSTFNINF